MDDFHGVGRGIENGAGWLAFLAQHFPRIDPQTVANLLLMKLVSMAGKDSLVIPGASQGPGIKGIVGDGYLDSLEFKFGVFTVEFQIRVLGFGYIEDSKSVAVAIAKDAMYIAVEAAAHYPGGNRRAEIAAID